MIQNFTPIDSLIEQYSAALGVPGITPITELTPQTTHKPLEQVFPDKIALSQISLPKEAAPGSSIRVEMPPIHEVVEKQEVELEVQPYIQVKPQNIKLDDELKKMGLQPIEKMKYKEFQTLNLPFSDEKIIANLHKPPTSGLRWLAEVALYILRQAHLKLKVVHGKVIRVLQK